MTRSLTAGEVYRVSSVASSTLDRWTAAGLLGTDKSGREGRGNHRTFTAVEALAVAAGMRWAKAGADADRVKGVVRLIAGCTSERLEAEFQDGKTFPVPAVMLQDFVFPGTGIFIKPEGMSQKAARLLDLARLWDEVRAAIAKLGSPPKRGPRPKQQQASK